MRREQANIGACCGAEALPGDLRSHKGELTRLTVRALVGCDERAWPAAVSAACGTAIALHGRAGNHSSGLKAQRWDYALHSVMRTIEIARLCKHQRAALFHILDVDRHTTDTQLSKR